MIRQYPDIFPDDLPPGLPPERPEDHKIQLEPGAQPTIRTQWRLTQPELEELRSQIDALLEKGFIRASTSPFAAPILFTPKKDGGLRMCIDYRALNWVTIKSRYPIPRTDALLDQLRGARYFSKIDLLGGYHQIRVFADDCHMAAFRTRYGSYEFTVMPFGLTNAPSTFQLTMNRVFRDLLDRCDIVYLDDILIFSKTREDHLCDLDAVFKRLQENRLITEGSMCKFFKQELEFLGHVISRDGIKIDPAKIKTIQEWKPPTIITKLQILLGFVNYVRRFIPNMAGITGPLTDLLHKDKNFVWGKEAEAAFQELKNFLVSPPVLCIADPSRPFKVVTDASDFAIGAVLLQDFGNGLQPIAYESRKLQAAERNYPIHDKEMLAIIHAFKLWRCYLVGADVTVRTDHKSLQYLRAQPNLNPRAAEPHRSRAAEQLSSSAAAPPSSRAAELPLFLPPRPGPTFLDCAIGQTVSPCSISPRFYHPTSRRVLSSQDVTFDESVPYYRLFPYRTAPLPPPPLFLVPGPPPVDPLPPQGPAPSGVSQVDAVEPVEVVVDSGAGSTGAEPGGAGSGGAAPGGAESGGAEPGGAESEGAEPGSAEPGGEEPGGAGSARVASRGASSRRELLSPQELREWFARRRSHAAGAGGTPGAARTGGAAAAAGVGSAGASGAAGTAGAAGGTGAAGPAGVGPAGASGATGAGAAGGVSVGGSPDAGPSAGAGVGAVGAGGAAGASAAAEGTGAVPAGSGDPARPRPYFVPLLEQVLGLPPSSGPAPSLECPQPVQSQSLLQPVSPLPAPSPYTGPTGGLAERRESSSRPASPVRAARTSGLAPRQRPPAVPRTHQMALRPSTASQRVPLPSPPASSLPILADPESDSLRAASPTVTRLLSTVVTDPSFESTAASTLVAELVDFAACCRLDYAAGLVAESASVSPPSVGGECALSTDVLEDRQEEFQCFTAALPHLVSMMIAPEGDLDAPDIPTPRSYAEAIEGPYSSQWQSAMDAEMASWKSTGTYVDEVPPPGANIGVDYFHTFSSTSKMTTLRVLLHVAAQGDYELHSLDFSTAFLQGSLHEEIWLRRPPGFTGSFPPGTQWSLRRPVYGLRQAPREWHDTLRTTLAALGFAPSTADPSLFLRTDTSLPPFYILVYVDDLVFATADTAGLAHVKSELQKRHTCTDLGELRSYLGLLTSGITQHVLGGRRPVVLTGHADASWADDQATQRSSQGYTFSLGSGSVSWRSTRSSSVLGSSCEAEIYAGAMAAQELRWLTYLLTDLGEPPRSPPVLYVDNKAMLALCREHRLEHRTKHIALRYFLARELQ
ncbi:unnamed protein product [Closterium sp. NIES-54]